MVIIVVLPLIAVIQRIIPQGYRYLDSRKMNRGKLQALAIDLMTEFSFFCFFLATSYDGPAGATIR